MRALRRMMAAVRNLFHMRQVESDLDAEIRAYVDGLTEEQIAAGMTPEEARRKALAGFGGTEPVKQAVRDSRAGTGIETIWQDVRFALRILRKSPGIHSGSGNNAGTWNRSQHCDLHAGECGIAAGNSRCRIQKSWWCCGGRRTKSRKARG